MRTSTSAHGRQLERAFDIMVCGTDYRAHDIAGELSALGWRFRAAKVTGARSAIADTMVAATLAYRDRATVSIEAVIAPKAPWQNARSR